MAFGNIAGRAGFVLELDKSQLDRGLPEAERQFNRATSSMAQSASRSGVSVGRGFDSLLGDVRRMRTQAEDLSGQITTVGTAAEASTGRLAGMGMVLARGGLVGIGISAAYQASRQLQDSLKTTGAEAFTTEGRFKNMGSALMSSDILGAFQAWSNQPKVVEDLGISAQQAAGRLDALRKVATGQAAVLRDMARVGENNAGATDEQRQALEKYNAIVKEAGTGNQAFAESLLEQGRAWNELSTQMRGALNDVLAFKNAQGQTILQGGFAGLRPAAPTVPAGQSILGPGAVPTQPGPVPIGPSAKNANAQTIAAASGDLKELLQLQVEARDRLAKALENSHGNVKQREALNQQLAAATAAVIGTQKAIDANAKASADAASAEKAAAAEKARQAAETAAANRKAAVEQGLENEIAKAALTKRTTDDEKAFKASIDYWRSLARAAKNTKDREDAEAKVIALRAGLEKVRTGDDPAGTTDEARQLRELKLANNVAKAALTERKTDDRKFLTQQLNYYIGLRKDLIEHGKRLEAEQQTSTIVGIRGRIAALNKETEAASGSMAETFNRMTAAFLTNLQGITNQFGSNFASDQTATNTWQTAKLMERLVHGVDRLSSATAHPGAKYARNLMMEPYGGVGDV